MSKNLPGRTEGTRESIPEKREHHVQKPGIKKEHSASFHHQVATISNCRVSVDFSQRSQRHDLEGYQAITLSLRSKMNSLRKAYVCQMQISINLGPPIQKLLDRILFCTCYSRPGVSSLQLPSHCAILITSEVGVIIPVSCVSNLEFRQVKPLPNSPK